MNFKIQFWNLAHRFFVKTHGALKLFKSNQRISPGLGQSVVFSQKMPLLITFYSWISPGLGQRIVCWRPCTWHWCDVTFGRSDLRSKTAWWLHFDSRPTFDTSQDHQQTQPSWKNTGTMSGPMSNCRMLIQNMEVCICVEILFLYYVHSCVIAAAAIFELDFTCINKFLD